MKSEQQIREALDKVALAYATTKGLSKDQRLCLRSMLVALCWSLEDGGDTLEKVVQGVPIVAGTEFYEEGLN